MILRRQDQPHLEAFDDSAQAVPVIEAIPFISRARQEMTLENVAQISGLWLVAMHHVEGRQTLTDGT